MNSDRHTSTWVNDLERTISAPYARILSGWAYSLESEMALQELASCEGGNCPGIYVDDDGNVVVKGNKLGAETRRQLRFSPNEDGVVIPAWLLRQAVERTGRPT